MNYKLMIISQINNKRTGLGKAVNDLIEYYGNKYGKESLFQLDITHNSNFIKSCLTILFKSCDKFYFTPSGSIWGNIRDSFYLTLMLLKRRQIIAHFHNSSFKSIIESNRILNSINRIIYQKVEKIIILGYKQKEMFSSMEISNDKFYIVRNGIDKDLFITKQCLIQKHNQKFINIIYFSNMIVDKGYREVLSIAKKMYKERNFHFYFSGIFFDSDLESEFLNEIKGLDNVTYISGVYGEAKKALLARMNFFILPSKYKDETLPISMLEAVANGLYIIISNIGVISEVINPNTTTLLDHIDEDFILSEIKQKSFLLKHLDYNIEYFENNYSNEKVLNKLLRIIEG